MAATRFYCPELRPHETIRLPDDEAVHAARVLRVAVGDACELFDGRSGVAAATVASVSKREVLVAADEVRREDRTLSGHLEVAIGLPRGDRQRNVIERATELGVHSLIPLSCEFGVAEATPSAIARAQRTTIESCKQCGRNRLLEVRSPFDATEFFSAKQTPAAERRAIRLLCHPRLSDAASLSRGSIETLRRDSDPIVSVALAIGPEGGFSESEVSAALASGWQPLDLGSRILRVETALAAAATFAGLLLDTGK